VRVTPFSPFAPSAAYDPAVNGGSGYFDGSGDNLVVSATSSLSFGTGDFALSAWIYPLTVSGVQIILETRTTTNPNPGAVLYLNGATLSVARDNTNVVLSGGTVTVGQWQFVELTRTSGDWRIFLNGVATAGPTNNTTNFSANSPLYIGSTSSSTQYFNGYISSARILNGAGGTTSTVPTTPLTAITNTAFLCNFTNAGIFDNTGKNVLETVGNAQIDTTTKKYGTGSMEFDGTGDWLLIPYSPEFVFGSGNFTIEGWVYPSTTGTVLHICGVNNTSTPAVANQTVVMYKSTTEKLISYAAVGSTSFTCTSSGNLTANQWSHVAFVRSGSTLTQYINGVADGTANISTNSINNVNSPFAVGQVGQLTTTGWNGYIDDLRITKGVARYTANFTPPISTLKLR